MGKLQSSIVLLALCFSSADFVVAAIGPVADLTISNADISPDGFTRAAIVMNDQFPGPLISGSKVRITSTSWNHIADLTTSSY